MGSRLRTRFAPTPSGFLHVGNAWSFVLTWLAARSQGGSIHLRVDDLDAVRFREEYVEDVFASLRWLELDWDSGPGSPAELRAGYSQQSRLHRYAAALEKVRARGRLFACACSREEVRRNAEAAGRPNVYPGTCRHLDLHPGVDRALRFRVTDSGEVPARDESGKPFSFRPDRDMGDFIVRQKNGDPAYHLVSVVDDEELGVNFVVRGLDLLPSTGAQLALAEALGCEHFPRARFWHHDLVLTEGGEKLSKSAGAESLRALRERFPDPAPLYRCFARRLGLGDVRVAGPRDLLPGFGVDKVPLGPLRFEAMMRELGA